MGTPWSHSVPLVVAECPRRLSLAERWWLSLSESCVLEVHWGPHGGRPCQWVGLGRRRGQWTWKSRGHGGCRESLQRPFQPRSGVNTACQSLYSIGQQVVRKLDPLRGGRLAFPTLRQPCGYPPGHGFPTTWGVHYFFNSTKPTLPHFLPPSLKPVQQLSGFTDTAGKALWRQPCRHCMKQKEDRLTWAAPRTWCVWNGLEKERRTSPLLRGGHRYFCCSRHLCM